ncbi:MAG: hypothetical protein M3407_09845, partial [Acidobacteriota bacterium]|nr:hypothetical protein [Acidobacteriota bacterium]
MSEFEAEWARRIGEAERRARAAGRGDVADYLALRAANDATRSIGVAWLIETFTAHAATLNRHAGASITIDLKHEAGHRFRVGLSTMVGARLILRAGVRTITVEAGWPRTPADGIVRGGGLACAVVSHFGDRRAGEEFLLVRAAGQPPRWLVLEESGTRPQLLEERVLRH